MIKKAFLKKWHHKIESFVEIQQLVFEYNLETADYDFITIFPEEIFYCRSSLLNILQIVISNASIKNAPLIYLFFNHASAQIKSFFTSEDIFSLLEHNFIRLWLFENGFIEFDTILAAAEISPSIFQYFSIEIKENDPTEFQRVQKYSPNEKFRNLTEKIDFSTFREQRSKFMNDSKIAQIIRNDDVDSFQQILSQNNISINSTIPYSIFEACEYVNRSEVNMPTLIEFASFCGSIHVFKFLMMNEAKLKPSTIDYAINGGNFEIIHILENDPNCSFETALDAAIHDQRDEIVDYIIDNKGKSFNIDSACTAIVNVNYKVIDRVIELLYEDPNAEDSEGVTALIYACENNCVEVVNMLMSIPSIDVNKSDRNDVKFPILAAARNNAVDALNVLLKNSNFINVNKKNCYGYDALMTAVFCGNFEVVQILCDLKNISFKTNFNYSTNKVIKIAILYNRVKIIKFLLNIYIFNKNFLCSIDSFITKAFAVQNWEMIKYFLSIHPDLWKINVFQKIRELNNGVFTQKDIKKLELLIDKFRKDKVF